MGVVPSRVETISPDAPHVWPCGYLPGVQFIHVTSERVMEFSRFWPTETVGTEIGWIKGEIGAKTVTLALTAARWGELEKAVIKAEPCPTPVTVTMALVAPGAKFALPTVATAGAFVITLTVRPPAGACPPTRFSETVADVPAFSVTSPEKLSVGADTVTVGEAEE